MVRFASFPASHAKITPPPLLYSYYTTRKNKTQNMTCNSSCSNSLGLLILRLSTGGLLLFHGVAKLLGGLTFLQGMLATKGLPGFLAYGAVVGEVLAPLALILGLFTRGAAAVVAFNMLVAIAMAHLGTLCSVAPNTGGWAVELPMLYLLPALALIFTGGGRFAVSTKTCLD